MTAPPAGRMSGPATITPAVDGSTPRPVDRATAPLLIVVPVAGPAVSPTTVLAGLPLVTRIIRAAKVSGYAEITVVDGDAAIRRLAEDAGASILKPSSGVTERRRRIVVLAANVVPQPRWLRALRDAPIAPEQLYVDSGAVVVVETERPAIVVAAVAAAGSAPALVGALADVFDTASESLDRDGRLLLAAPRDLAAAEDWLLQSLIKHNEGFMSRHVERRISLAITRRLAPTRMTPNAMTLISLAIGLVGAGFFLGSSPALQLTGALLFLAHSILDGCDGELARLKFLQSRWGAILDFWGDNVVHVTVFLCIAVGWTLTSTTAWPLALGVLASVGTLGSAALMFRHTAEDRAENADSPLTARLAAALASRDFIYALIVCAAFGKAAWFLVAVAFGTPAFFAMVLWSKRRRGGVR